MFIVPFFQFGDVWYPISFPPNGSYQKFLLRMFRYCELPGNEPVTQNVLFAIRYKIFQSQFKLCLVVIFIVGQIKFEFAKLFYDSK